MTGFLSGCAIAMPTPFTDSGVNYRAFTELAEYLIAGNADALVVLGTTGEPSTMTEEERVSLIRHAVKLCAGRVKVIVGAGSNCTAHAEDSARLAEELGADGVLVVTPYYNKCTQRGLYEYYKAVCGAVKIPVIAYSVPSRTGVNLLPETAEAIADIPNLAGIKEASGNMAQIMETARRIRGKCELYSGDDALNLPILCAGGTAVISVVANLAPRDVKSLVEAVRRGALEEAIARNDSLLPLCHACFSEVNPIPVKAGVGLLGIDAGKPRPPLTEIEPAHLELLRTAMIGCGLKVTA